MDDQILQLANLGLEECCVPGKPVHTRQRKNISVEIVLAVRNERIVDIYLPISFNKFMMTLCTGLPDATHLFYIDSFLVLVC